MKTQKKEETDQAYTPVCALCEQAVPLCGERMKGLFFCRREGVVDASCRCGKFSFDPLKRTPPPRPRFQGLDDGSPEDMLPREMFPKETVSSETEGS